MSWEDFRTFLMTSQPFRLRQMFYQLNQKGANLAMLGSQREKVNRLMERFRRISTDEQRQVFPEYFRDRDSARNALQRQSSADDNSSNNTAYRRTSRLRPYHVNRPLNGIINEHHLHAHQPLARFERRQDSDYQPPDRIERRQDADHQPTARIERRQDPHQPPARIERLYVPRAQYTFNSQNVRERQPQTPNIDLRPTLSETFDFPSPLRLAATGHAPADRATYQLTPRPQRRTSFSGSPAPPNGESRRRSMSVSMEGNGPCVTAAKTEDSRGKMANLECKICMDEQVECAFKPCGHACACYDCARHLGFRLGRCPICRGVIAEIIRIYW